MNPGGGVMGRVGLDYGPTYGSYRHSRESRAELLPDIPGILANESSLDHCSPLSRLVCL
jgi:hypothetical protein